MNDIKIANSSILDTASLESDLVSETIFLNKDYCRVISISKESSSDKIKKRDKLTPKDNTNETIQNSTIKQTILESQTKILKTACEMDTNQVKENFKNRFLQLLQSVEFEFGYRTPADDYIQKSLNSYGVFVREWINEIFLQNFECPHVLSAILRIIAHFEYSQMYPQGITIAIAATRHEDVEVQECGVRCFENWESPDSIPILNNIKFSEEWLNGYLKNVIIDLEEIGVKCLS